jgi:ParB/RepB/Spo0J family partition protein
MDAQTSPSDIDVVQLRMRVHNALRGKGLSIAAAERECAVSVGTFQKFIAGGIDMIGAGNLAKIAALTGVAADTLLFGEGHSPGGVGTGPVIGGAVRLIPHSAIQPSALNPRKRGFDPEALRTLADSILAQGGVLQNLVVRPIDPAAAETGPFEIMAGERRWRAYALLIAEGKAAEDVALPCAVRALGDDDAMELMLVENMERRDLSPMEEGRAFLELWNRRSRALGKRKAGDVVKHLAEKLHRSERWIQKRIRLARDLVPEAQAALEEGKILLAHAEVLATAPKDAQVAQTGLLVALPLETQPAARDIGQSIASSLPDLALAVFKRKDYDADVFEFDGKDFAVDIPFFARLQDKAIEARRAEYANKFKAGELAFVDEGPVFKASSYHNCGKPMDDGEPNGGVFIEVQDKGAWRVARFIVDLAAVGQTDHVRPVPRDRASDDGDDADQGDLDVKSRPAKTVVTAGRTPQESKDLIEKQFGPLRSVLNSRFELCLALLIFEDIMFEVGEFDDNARLRFAPSAAFSGKQTRAEHAVVKLGLSWPSPDDDGAAFAMTLLNALIEAPLGQLQRLAAQIMSDDVGTFQPIELNPLERRLFEAAGLDPDAATVIAKEAA